MQESIECPLFRAEAAENVENQTFFVSAISAVIKKVFKLNAYKTTILANLLILSSPKYMDENFQTGFIEELYAQAGSDQLSGKPLWPCM
jgi:hypothetical protein